MTTNLLSFIIIISVLLFGSVEIWSVTLILLMVYTLGLFWTIRSQSIQSRADYYKISDTEKLLLFTFTVFILYAFIQALPFPSFLLKYISPSAFEMQAYYSFGSIQSMHISLHTYNSVLEALRFLAFFIVFTITMLNFKNRDNLTRTLKILVIFGFSLSIFAIAQKATWNEQIYWFRELTQGGTPFGPFVNRNHYAGLINMLVPLGLGLSITRKTKEKKILFGFITVIMSVSIFFCLSRGGIISFFAGIALFSILMIISRVQTKKIWMIIFFLIIVFAYLIYLGIDPIIDRIYKSDLTTEQRFAVWSATLNAIKDFWSAGSGLGTFITIFPLYYPVETQLIYSHAHNDYIEFILETGAVGTILLIIFASLSIYSIAKSSLRGKTGMFLIAAVSSAFTMIVHSIFDFNLHILSNALLFSSVMGMIIALSNNSKPEINADAETLDKPTIKTDKAFFKNRKRKRLKMGQKH